MQIKNLMELYQWTHGGSNVIEKGLEEKVIQHMSYRLLLKYPGNGTEEHALRATARYGVLQTDKKIPLKITQEIKSKAGSPLAGIPMDDVSVQNDHTEIIITIEAASNTYFSFQGKFEAQGMHYETSYLYLPGFWYRKNLHSPQNTPSLRVSKNWIVRFRYTVPC